jgi:hypothetical protein
MLELQAKLETINSTIGELSQKKIEKSKSLQLLHNEKTIAESKVAARKARESEIIKRRNNYIQDEENKISDREKLKAEEINNFKQRLDSTSNNFIEQINREKKRFFDYRIEVENKIREKKESKDLRIQKLKSEMAEKEKKLDDEYTSILNDKGLDATTIQRLQLEIINEKQELREIREQLAKAVSDHSILDKATLDLSHIKQEIDQIMPSYSDLVQQKTVILGMEEKEKVTHREQILLFEAKLAYSQKIIGIIENLLGHPCFDLPLIEWNGLVDISDINNIKTVFNEITELYKTRKKKIISFLDDFSSQMNKFYKFNEYEDIYSILETRVIDHLLCISSLFDWMNRNLDDRLSLFKGNIRLNYRDFEAYYNAINNIENQIHSYNRKLAESLNDLQVIDSIEGLNIELTTKFNSLEEYKALKSIKDLQLFINCTDEEVDEFIKYLSIYSKNPISFLDDKEIKKFISVKGSVSEKGIFKKFNNENELKNISSTGLTQLIIVMLFIAIFDQIRKGNKDIRLCWTMDETGRIDDRNIGRFVEKLEDMNISLICAEPNDKSIHCEIFDQIVRIENYKISQVKYDKSDLYQALKGEQND